jgi:Bacterial PH domain
MAMDIRNQTCTGVIPPAVAESLIREVYPSVARVPAVAALGKTMMFTIILAPVAWLMMAGLYFGKIAPFAMRRYALTNRRVMIRKGWAGKPSREAALDQIGDIRLVRDGNSDFFRAANLEVVSLDGQVLFTFRGVPDPESFRHAILNTRNAWVPGMAARSTKFMPASAAK